MLFLSVKSSFLLLKGSLFMSGLVCSDMYQLKELQTPSALEQAEGQEVREGQGQPLTSVVSIFLQFYSLEELSECQVSESY